MNMHGICNVIHGQCTKEFIDQMRTYPEYELANNEYNVISLVEIICKICYRHNHKMYKPQAILFSVKALINYLQHNTSSID